MKQNKYYDKTKLPHRYLQSLTAVSDVNIYKMKITLRSIRHILAVYMPKAHMLKAWFQSIILLRYYEGFQN